MYCTVLTYGPEDVDNDHGDLYHVSAATLHLTIQTGVCSLKKTRNKIICKKKIITSIILWIQYNSQDKVWYFFLPTVQSSEKF